jgi:hypothetical protein
VEWAGPDYARIDRENCEMQDAITAREEALAATSKDRARYREDLARIANEAAAQRARSDSSLVEVVECWRQEDVASFREQNRLRKERRTTGQARMCPLSGHAGGQ